MVNEKTGKRARGKNFSAAEILNMLGVVEDVLPLGALEWETKIAPRHSQVYPKQARSAIRCD